MQQIESELARTIAEWFTQVLDGLEESGYETKAKWQEPLPGFVLGRMTDEAWWMLQKDSLAKAMQTALMGARERGTIGASRQLAMQLDWDLLLPQALQWAQEHAAALVTRIEASIRPVLHQAVVEGLQQGQPWRNIREKMVRDAGMEKWRAERIARTEVIRAHAKGAEEGYIESGTVRGVRWLDGQDEACPLCKALNNQVRKIGEPFYRDTFGDGLPPRHPHCRCAIAPVTLEQVKRLPTDHPLRDNRRDSVAGLTDSETWTEISGILIEGQRKRHWRYRHPKEFKDRLAEAEGMIPKLLTEPLAIKKQPKREGVVHILPWTDKAYLIAPIRNGRMTTMFPKNRRDVAKWPDI